jgi:hypothetical protein
MKHVSGGDNGNAWGTNGYAPANGVRDSGKYQGGLDNAFNVGPGNGNGNGPIPFPLP